MTKKTRIRIGIVVVIISVMWFSDWSFAADGGDATFGTIAWLMNFIVSVLSWIWILLAKVVGELLTNKWVYGEVIGIDVLLWRYRNIVKNLANFGLGFYFVYIVFKALIGKEDITKKFKDMILWILIAGIGIQASWFLTAVIVDVSTITLVAAGSLPSQVISQTDQLRNSIDNSLIDFKDDKGEIIQAKKIELFPQDASASKFLMTVNENLSSAKTEQEVYDALMPNADTISGPLYFMGVSILKAYRIPSVNTSKPELVKKTIFNLIVQGGTTIVYSIEMFVLFAVAFMRLLYLWMFIILSPLVVLVTCLQKMNKKDKTGLDFLDKIMQQVDLKSFLLNVFKPTVIVFGISLSMLLVVMMNGLINKTEDYKVNIDGVNIESSKPSGQEGDQTYRTSISTSNGSYEFNNIGKGIGDFIISVLTVILVYFVIKTAVTMGGGKDFVSKNIETLQKNIEGAMTSMPLVPVPGYDKNGFATTRYMNVGSTFGIGGDSIAKRYIENKTSTIKSETASDVDNILNTWGVNEGLTEKSKHGITTAISKWGTEGLTAAKGEIDKIKTSEGKGMSLASNAGDGGFWVTQFEQWLENSKDKTISGTNNDRVWNDMVKWWNDEQNKNNRTLQALFGKVSGAAEAYAKFFGYTSGNYVGFDSIKDLDISKK